MTELIHDQENPLNLFDEASKTSASGELKADAICLDDKEEVHTNASNRLKIFLTVYFFATLATLIKTIAWWFNQWPFMKGYNFGIVWIVSALIAGCEYLPMTFAFTYASSHGVALSLMTSYMEAADNSFRMLQQLGLGDPLQ